MSDPIRAALPDREPDGEFQSFQEWVNKAASWIGGTNSLCVDAQGRICRMGMDFMRARDEGTFPVSFWFGAGWESEAERRRSERAARRIMGDFKFRLRESFYGR
jgi:hypothetical protein